MCHVFFAVRCCFKPYFSNQRITTKQTSLCGVGLWFGTATGRDTLIGGFESTRIPQMPLVEFCAPVMLRKLVLQLQDRFSREILEGLSSHSDGAWIHIYWIGSRYFRGMKLNSLESVPAQIGLGHAPAADYC